VRAFPRTVPGTKPGAGDDPGGFTVKFVEGSHVRLLSERFVIAPLAMLDEDPQLLRCADLTAPQAVCDVEALDASLFQHPGIAVSRNSTRPEAELDRERAAGRADGGEYLGDLNLFYLVRVPFSELETVYDLFAHSPVVEAVYYNPITQP
jgi:hypothetical protein